MRRALRIAPSQSVSVGLASATTVAWPAHPMMTMDHSRMLSSSTRPALKPSTGLRWRSDVSSRLQWRQLSSASSMCRSSRPRAAVIADRLAAEGCVAPPPPTLMVGALIQTPPRHRSFLRCHSFLRHPLDATSRQAGSVAHSPSSCFLRISDELAVALLAGESGRLDPGRDEG